MGLRGSMTIHEAMAHINRALITKTGESPSVVNRQVRAKLFNPLIVLDKEFPGNMAEVAKAIDYIEPKRSLAYYVGASRAIVQSARHELSKTEARPAAKRDKSQPQGIGSLLAGMQP